MVATADVIRSYYAEYLQNQEAFGNQTTAFTEWYRQSVPSIERSIPNEYAPQPSTIIMAAWDTEAMKILSRQYSLATISHKSFAYFAFLRDGYESPQPFVEN